MSFSGTTWPPAQLLPVIHTTWRSPDGPSHFPRLRPCLRYSFRRERTGECPDSTQPHHRRRSAIFRLRPSEIGVPLYLNQYLFNATADSTSILHITEIRLQGDGFSFYSPPNALSIPGDGTRVSLPIRFVPADPGLPTGALTIVAPGAPNSPLTVPLMGSGVVDSLLFTMGMDDQGKPLLCGTVTSPQLRGLPSTRTYEVIPCVLRDLPEEPFVVEVDVGGPVIAVTNQTGQTDARLIAPAYPIHTLLDDGLGYDRIAGDFVFTSGAFHYDLGDPIGRFRGDPESPDGLDFGHLGSIRIEELDHTIWEFAIRPTVGLLRLTSRW